MAYASEGKSSASQNTTGTDEGLDDLTPAGVMGVGLSGPGVIFVAHESLRDSHEGDGGLALYFSTTSGGISEEANEHHTGEGGVVSGGRFSTCEEDCFCGFVFSFSGVSGLVRKYMSVDRRWHGSEVGQSSRVSTRGCVPSSFTIVSIRVLNCQKKKKDH